MVACPAGGRSTGADPGEVAVLKLTWTNVFIWLTIAFVILFIWNSPDAASEQIGAFLGDVGSFFQDLFDKIGQFFAGLMTSAADAALVHPRPPASAPLPQAGPRAPRAERDDPPLGLTIVPGVPVRELLAVRDRARGFGLFISSARSGDSTGTAALALIASSSCSGSD